MDDGDAPPRSYPRIVYTVVPGRTPPVATQPGNPELMPAWVSSEPSFFRWMATTAAAHRRTKRARVAAATEAILQEVTGDFCLGEECAICLQDFRADDTLRAMPHCSHAFHHRCISKWIRRKAACPLCRRHLLPTAPTATPEEEEEDQDDDGDEGGEEDDQDDDGGLEWEDGAIGGESS
ncbi:unnamed protein product [Urochloa humidicola]